MTTALLWPTDDTPGDVAVVTVTSEVAVPAVEHELARFAISSRVDVVA